MFSNIFHVFRYIQADHPPKITKLQNTIFSQRIPSNTIKNHILLFFSIMKYHNYHIFNTTFGKI